MYQPGLKFRLLLAASLALACSAASAQGCGTRRGEVAPGAGQSQTPTPAPSATPTPAAGVGAGEQKSVTEGGVLEVIETGSQSRVPEAFVAVARDAETYEAIRRLHESLPALRPEFFRANAVAAAFLGRRNTGGYSVEIARDAEGVLRVSEAAPPEGAMVTMALTAPYRVVSFAQWPEQPVRLQLGDAWRRQSRPYRVTSGEFTMSGGFAGVRQRFRLAGTFGVLRHKHLATFIFDLKGEADDAAARALSDAATGTVDGSRRVSILQLDPGSLVHPPRRAMRAEGQFSASEHRLTLKLDGTQLAVADGFGGYGTLEADATGPAPPKRDDDNGSERM
jgi:hypothetical protein